MGMLRFALLCTTIVSGAASAQQTLQGADDENFKNLVSNIIAAQGLTSFLNYIGEGSDKGEADLKHAYTTGQRIAPMSRAFNPAAPIDPGVLPIQDNAFAKDATLIFTKGTNPVKKIDYGVLKNILTCVTRDWSQVPGHGSLTGTINVYVRDAHSSATDLVRDQLGLPPTYPAGFPCLKICTGDNYDCGGANRALIGGDSKSIGYLSNSGKTSATKALMVSRAADVPAGSGSYDPADVFTTATGSTVCDGTYPLYRQLHVYAAGGSLRPTGAQLTLLQQFQRLYGPYLPSATCSQIASNDFYACGKCGNQP